MIRFDGAVVVGFVAMAVGCLRAPISDEAFGDDEIDASSTGAVEHTDSLSMSGPIVPGMDTSDGGDPSGACHPSYVPCLPVVDDLDCDDVRALESAPVQVVGEDEYGLDADHDGVGCES